MGEGDGGGKLISFITLIFYSNLPDPKNVGLISHLLTMSFTYYGSKEKSSPGLLLDSLIISNLIEIASQITSNLVF